MRTELKKIGVIGDVHAEDELLEKTIMKLKSLQVNEIFCTGDIVDGPGSAVRCISLLNEHNVKTVSGNHDRWLLKSEMRNLEDASLPEDLDGFSRQFLESLDAEYEFNINDIKILLCHGIGKNDMSKINPDDFGYAIEVNDELQEIIRAGKIKIIINGHSHKRMVKKIESLFIVNAGTLFREHSPTFLMIDFTLLKVDFYTFDADFEPFLDEGIFIR